MRTSTVMTPVQPGSDEVEFHEVIGGVGGVVKKVNLADYYQLSTTYKFKTQVKKDLIYMWLDDKPVMAYFLSSGYPTGTKCEIMRYYEDNGIVFDNFLAKDFMGTAGAVTGGDQALNTAAGSVVEVNSADGSDDENG